MVYTVLSPFLHPLFSSSHSIHLKWNADVYCKSRTLAFHYIPKLFAFLPLLFSPSSFPCLGCFSKSKVAMLT